MKELIAQPPAAEPKSLRDMTEKDFDAAHAIDDFNSAIGHVTKTSPVEVKMYARVGYGDLLIVGEKLYRRPDPRVSELEALLRECLTSIDRVNDWELQERIEAALGEGT